MLAVKFSVGTEEIAGVLIIGARVHIFVLDRHLGFGNWGDWGEGNLPREKL